MASIQTPTQTVDSSPIPMPGIYKEQQALAQKAYQTSLANINQRRQAMLTQYGMTGNVDAQGAYSNYRIDPANQYGQLQMMKQNQGLQLNDAWNQAAERNLGNSGLAAQGESLLKYSQGGEAAQLGQDFITGMGGLAQEDVSNQDTLAQGMYQAQAQARNEAIQQQMFQLANSGGGGAGGLGGGSGGNLEDFMYGTSVNGYSDEQLYAAGQAANNGTPMHIMHNGEVTYQNGQPGVYMKFQKPDGFDTIWVPIGAPSSGGGSTQQNNTPPPPPVAPTTITNTGISSGASTASPTAARAALIKLLAGKKMS